MNFLNPTCPRCSTPAKKVRMKPRPMTPEEAARARLEMTTGYHASKVLKGSGHPLIAASLAATKVAVGVGKFLTGKTQFICPNCNHTLETSRL